MIPEQVAVGSLIQFGDADTVPVRLDMLGDDIHGNLAEVQIGADPGGSCDAGGSKNILQDHLGELSGGSIVK